jgi:hypothetical protein
MNDFAINSLSYSVVGTRYSVEQKHISGLLRVLSTDYRVPLLEPLS